MADNFHSEIQQGNVSLRFWFYIQGIPYIFLDGALPVGSDGTSFASTVPYNHLHFSTYHPQSEWTVKENIFDVSKGLESIGADISRRTGVTSPGQMKLTLRDDGSGFLVKLFARDSTEAAKAEITQNLTLQNQTPTATSQLIVDDHDGFDSSGLLYVGKETIKYTTKLSGGGVDWFEGLSRNICALQNHDVYYDQNDYKASSPRVISSNPRSWAGRYVRVFAFLVDEFGRALNRGAITSGWGNNDGYQLEIFRGIMPHSPRVMSDWTRWRVPVKGLEVLLDQEIGGNFPEGSLINSPGNKKWNEEGFQDPDGAFAQYDENHPALMLLPGANRIHMRITKYASWLDATSKENPQQVNEFLGDDALTVSDSTFNWSLSEIDSELIGSVGSVADLWFGICNAINEGINTAGWEEYIHASFKGVGDGVQVRLTIQDNAPAQAGFNVEVFWGYAGSVGQMLPYTKNMSATLATDKPDVPWRKILDMKEIDKESKIAGIVTKDATQIIYWLKGQPDGGEAVEPVPSHGYAIIGGKEIIKYEADIDVDAKGLNELYFAGMRVLKGVTRGVFDTPKTEHIMTVDMSQKITSEAVDIKFGWGLDEDSWSDGFLKLAHSTGITSNNGSFDVNSKEIGAAISQHHFDVQAFNAYAKSGGDAIDRKIRFFSSEAVNMKAWIEDFLKPRMCYVAAGNHGHNDYEYLLSLVQIRPPLESEYVATLTADDIDFEDPATFQAGNSRIVNRVRCNYRWDFLEEKETKDQVIATDWDSVQDSGGIKSVTWKLKGQQWSYAQAYSRVTMWALRAFQRFAQDYDILNCKVNRKGLRVQPGDTVKLTLAGAPTNKGVRGFNAATAVCIRADHQWHSPNDTPTSILTLVIENQIRHSIYCPSAKTHSATTIDGSPAILVEDNVFSATGNATIVDGEYFEAGDLVVVHNPGNYATRDLRTIVSITTATSGGDTYKALVLNSALSNATAGGTNPAIVTFQQYSAVTSTQKEHAFIASDSNALSVSNTESFKYI